MSDDRAVYYLQKLRKDERSSSKRLARLADVRRAIKWAAITDPITKVPDNAAAMRSPATPHVRTASVDGDSFPAVIVKNSSSEVILYDLTSPPPVRRMYSGGAVKLRMEAAGVMLP